MQFKRIAVWNTAFLGDAVLTLPLIQTLKLHYPEARIDFYVRSGFTELFSAHPAINEAIAFDKRGRQKGLKMLTRMGGSARDNSYDLWISAHQSMRSGLIARMSRAAVRIGYKNGLSGMMFYNRRVNRRFDELQEIERLLELAKPLGITEFSVWPEIYLTASAQEKAREYFERNVNAPLLGLHPGSVWATKRWPTHYFASIGCMAIEEGAQVMVFGGPGEGGIAEQVMQRIREEMGDKADNLLLDVSGMLTLPDLAAFISRLNCYVTNDSGPMHLAWTQHVPVVAMFGPTVRKLGFEPRGKNSIIMEVNDLPCRPCSLHGPQQCPQKHHRCMVDMQPEVVWQAVHSRLFNA